VSRSAGHWKRKLRIRNGANAGWRDILLRRQQRRCGRKGLHSARLFPSLRASVGARGSTVTLAHVREIEAQALPRYGPAPSPLVGKRGVGVVARMVSTTTTPTPNPSPQGRGEQARRVALLCTNFTETRASPSRRSHGAGDHV